MPELPEVETIAKDLQQLIGKECTDYSVHYSNIIHTDLNQFINKKVDKVFRRGKYLIISFGAPKMLCFHLGMTGQLFVRDYHADNTKLDKHLIMHLSFDSDKELFFYDQRKFGSVYETEATDARITKNLGIDALEVDWLYLESLATHKFRNGFRIKSFLMNQRVISGLGNIYTCEILALSKIRPDRWVNTLTTIDWARIINNMKDILRNAIADRGSSVSNYVDGYGQPGTYQTRHRVYRQKKCRMCGADIDNIKIEGRSSYFCPSCQK